MGMLCVVVVNIVCYWVIASWKRGIVLPKALDVAPSWFFIEKVLPSNFPTIVLKNARLGDAKFF